MSLGSYAIVCRCVYVQRKMDGSIYKWLLVNLNSALSSFYSRQMLTLYSSYLVGCHQSHGYAQNQGGVYQDEPSSGSQNHGMYTPPEHHPPLRDTQGQFSFTLVLSAQPPKQLGKRCSYPSQSPTLKWRTRAYVCLNILLPEISVWGRWNSDDIA